MEKNKSYEYAVNEVPPIGHLLMSAVQHVLLMFVALGIPVIFASQLSGTAEFTADLITFSMIATGLGSIIQSVGLPFIGSGYLCPNVCGPSYMSLSLSAAWVGGLPLMRGMIILAGLVEMALAPLIQKLKKVFPTFIVGLVVTMVGVSIIKMSVTSVFGLSLRGDAIRSLDIVIGLFSLMVMVLCNIWGRGFIKMYCLFIGMISGWILAVVLIPEYWHNLFAVKDSPIFALPSIGHEFRRITFDFKMIIPFVVIAISGSLKSFGNLLAAQKISEPELKEANFVPIRKGLLADGFSTALAGLLGGMAVDTSSSNIGLAGATKVVSRWISVAAGVFFIILAFFPKFTTALSLMPKPVLGASLIFAGCFMICTGLQEMFSENWDSRKTFVIGISFFFGLSTAFLPGLYARAPQFIKTFFTDPLPTATILAVFLNQIFNLDILFLKLKRKLSEKNKNVL
ncbi:MAG: solute carrier family 23 protein [Candidatus Theseobacter exili]|nr:solute carrier family 23 protein [Candidatus Theseobacter exili]